MNRIFYSPRLLYFIATLLAAFTVNAQSVIPYGTNTVADCSPQLAFTVKHTACNVASGSITFTISGFGDRPSVAYSLDNGVTTVNQPTSGPSYTFTGLKAGNYQVYAIWGNGDCPTSYGSIQVYGQCDTSCIDFPVVRINRKSVGCEPTTGSITFNVIDFGDRETVRFSIDGGATFAKHALAEGDFTAKNLSAGTYSLLTDWTEGDCKLDLGSLELIKNCIVAEPCKGPYISKNGMVIMEVEQTASPYDQWILKTDVDGFTGTGHLEFTGNNQASGPPMSPLNYSFTVPEGQDGLYRLIIKSRKRLEGQPPDRSNDGYVKLRGNYGEGPDAGDDHNDDARLADLRRSVKFFGGGANSWGWAQKLDLGGHNNKRLAVYDLRAGETYTFTLSGRSQNYNADKIVFYRMADYSLEEAKNIAFTAGETCENTSNNQE